MDKPLVPKTEEARLAALREYAVLDTPAEASFDALTELAAQIVGVPITLVSLVDADRQWFKSRYGLDVPETPRDVSFCGHVVALDVPLVVPDALLDDRFCDNPLVTGKPNVRFYAGMPIRSPSGFVLGTLCAIDPVPHEVTPEKLRMLELLAKQVEAQLELRRQHRRMGQMAAELRSVVDHANCSLIEFDPQGSIRLFSAAAERLLGYEAAEVIGRLSPVAFLKAEEVEARAGALSVEVGGSVAAGMDALTVLAKRGGVDEREWTHVRKDGSEFIGELAVTGRRDDSGVLCGYLAVLNDVTARKEAAERLRDRAWRLRLSADVGAASATSLTVVQLAYGAAEAIVEHIEASRACVWTLDELTGLLSCEATIDSGSAPPPSQSPPSATGTGVVGRIAETRQRYVADDVRADPWLMNQPWLTGSVATAFAGFPLLSGERLLGVLTVLGLGPFAEATLSALGFAAETLAAGIARKRADEAVAQFKLIVDSLDDAVLTFDPVTLQISYANRGATQQSGFTTAELCRMVVPDLAPLVMSPENQRLLGAVITGEAPAARAELMALTKSGEQYPVDVLVQLVEPGRNRARLVAIARDISERKRLDRLKSEFVSTVSHELRTPLTSIRGALGLVAAGVLGELPPQAKEYVGIALSNSERLIRLVNDILDMEKLQSGGMEFELRPVYLAPVVERAVEANTGFGDYHHVSVRIVADAAQRAQVLGDEGRLTQVITNLLSNAIKFSPRDGVVEVSTASLAGRLRVTIRDHGPGISEAFRARIFERFSQADASTTRNHGGSGLGLSIAKALVERMGGAIGFEDAVGGGTSFYFELPVVAE